MRPNSTPLALALAASTTLMAATFVSSAQAETTLSIFGGANFSPHSTVDYDFNSGTSGSETVAWDGASFEYPPYWGARINYWFDQAPAWGVGLEFTHAKVKADPLPADFDKLEFTDGINFLTLNAYYRYDTQTEWTPYAGVGLGLSIPHVEVIEAGSTVETIEYQVTGFAAQALVGVDYAITDNWSAFAEYKMTYGQVEADLSDGGSLSTDIISNQILFGITYKLF
ncbi:MAG: outer membrane beta-barrel protein [Pseudomonadota bacterium]